MVLSKKLVFSLKLSKLNDFFLTSRSKWFVFYGILYLFHFPGDWNWLGWSYYHGILIHLLFCACIFFESIYVRIQKLNSLLVNHIRTFLFLLLFVALNYQWVYKTQIQFSLLGYLIVNFGQIVHEWIPFIKEWNLIQFFPILIYFLLLDPFLTFSRHRVEPIFLMLVIYLLLIVNAKVGDQKKQIHFTPKQSNQKINRYLDQIPQGTNIVLVVLEGVARKHILEMKSEYINYSLLNGSHFWIPMPHTSKSLYTWMTGHSQLFSTRIEPDSINEEESLPIILKKRFFYQTQMIYTQSIYFEGMNAFFPNIFDKVTDKTILETKYNDKWDSFSWGMDDRVILSEFKQQMDRSKPFFVFIGMSQTHSPYFTNSISGSSLNKIQRHKKALEENVTLIDDLISFIKSSSDQETLLIVTADHGESFGEEGANAHNYSLYNQEVDVPFLLYLIQSNKLYIPLVGSSIHFKETLLQLMENKMENKEMSHHFLKSSYQPTIPFKTWNSEIQRGIVKREKKYIYHNDKNILFEMDWNDFDRKIINDPILKEKILKEIYAETSK